MFFVLLYFLRWSATVFGDSTLLVCRMLCLPIICDSACAQCQATGGGCQESCPQRVRMGQRR